jgi:hypothetical protein
VPSINDVKIEKKYPSAILVTGWFWSLIEGGSGRV